MRKDAGKESCEEARLQLWQRVGKEARKTAVSEALKEGGKEASSLRRSSGGRSPDSVKFFPLGK